MTFRIVTTATLGLALLLSAPVWAASEAPEKSQLTVEQTAIPTVEQTVTATQHTVQTRTGSPSRAGPALYRVGARTDGYFPFAYPLAGPPQVLPMLPVGLIAGSGLGF